MGDIPGHSAPVIRHKRIGGSFLAERRHGAVATDEVHVIPRYDSLRRTATPAETGITAQQRYAFSLNTRA